MLPRLLFVCLLLLAAGFITTAHARPSEGPPLSELEASDWQKRLNQIELAIESGDLPPAEVRQAFRDVQTITRTATSRLGAEEARLRPLRDELTSLGEPPAEGQPEEAPEIRSVRSEINERVTEIEVRMSELRLTRIRAENVETALIELQEAATRYELWKRSPPLWKTSTWFNAWDDFKTVAERIGAAPGEWLSQLGQEGTPWRLLLVVGAGIVGTLLGVTLRNALWRRLLEQSEEEDPSRAQVIAYALESALINVLLPVLALGAVALAIILLGQTDLLFVEMVLDLILSSFVYFLISGLGLAVLAPQNPSWRLLNVTPDGAITLNRRTRQVAVVAAFVVAYFAIANSAGVGRDNEFAAVSTLFADALLAALLIRLVPSRFWNTDESSPVSTPVLIISLALAILLVSVPLLDIVGYSALASWLLLYLVVTVVTVGFTLLIRAAAHELLERLLRPAGRLRLTLYHLFRFGDGGATFIRVVAGIVIDVVLFLGVTYGLLRLYGVPDARLARWAESLATGFQLGNVVISPLEIVVAALLVAGVMFVTGLLRRQIAERLRTGTRMDVGVRNAIVSGVGYVGVVLAILVGIAALGLDLTNFALIASALSVGIGFGLRAVVENFVAGLLLLIERPFKEGDWIIAAGTEGTVTRISVRSTEIQTFDRSSVIVPNSELITQPVSNWTHKNRMARIRVPVGVAYGSDTGKVRDILLACAAENENVLKYPQPAVIFQQFGASSLDFELRCFVKDTDFYLSSKSDINFAIDKAFRENGIEIPFPQQDLHVRAGEALEVYLTDEPPKKKAQTPQDELPDAPTAEAGTGEAGPEGAGGDPPT